MAIRNRAYLPQGPETNDATIKAVLSIHGDHDHLGVGPQGPDDPIGLGITGIGDKKVHSPSLSSKLVCGH